MEKLIADAKLLVIEIENNDGINNIEKLLEMIKQYKIDYTSFDKVPTEIFTGEELEYLLNRKLKDNKEQITNFFNTPYKQFTNFSVESL